LTVSNETAEKRLDGRDSSTVLYEYSFDTVKGSMRRYIEWKEFKPMCRVKPKDHAPELDIEKIRRRSFMIRSFFDQQHGDFRVSIECVFAYQGKQDSEEDEDFYPKRKMICKSRSKDSIDVL